MQRVLAGALFTPTSGPAPVGIDPLTLGPIAGWDFQRSTITVNADGTGGAPGAGGLIGRVTDLVGTNHMVLNGDENKPVLRTSDDVYGDWSAGLNHRLLSAVTIDDADAFTIIGCFRPRTQTNNGYLWCSRHDYAAAIHQNANADEVQVYNGNSSPASNLATLNALHVAVLVKLGTSSHKFKVDNGPWISGDFGDRVISGGLIWGNGPIGDPGRAPNADLDSLWPYGAALSDANIDAAIAWLLARKSS